MATRLRPLTSADALLDQQMSAYWEKALLGLIAAERSREAAAGGSDARVPWDVGALPWSALILAALWDERRPLKGRDIDRWIASIGGRAGTSSMRTTLAQMATSKSPAGTTVLVKHGKLYWIGPDLAAYFTKRWGKFRPAELRWGLIERAVEDRGGGDIKAATDQQLANMTRTVESKEVRAEIERRRLAGVWSGAVFIEGGGAAEAGAVAAAPREFKYPGMRMVHDGTEASYKPRPSEPAAPVLTANQLHMQKLRDDREKMRVRLPARPADGSKIFSNEEGTMFMTMSPEFILNDLSAEQEEAFNAWTDKRLEALAGASPGDGVSLYSDTHPDGPAVDEDDDISAAAVEEVEIEVAEPEDGCPNDPDDAPDDIDVIYPTEDELAAIMRGEVVGPAAPEGFDTDPADEG